MPVELTTLVKSLSARRAWIEILIILYAFKGVLVALRKESVDRNWLFLLSWSLCPWSLSARRAWIEIILDYFSAVMRQVALRKESVDRNGMVINGVSYDVCRSPQGERG